MSDNAKELPKIRVWKKDEMSKRIAFFKDLKGSKKGLPDSLLPAVSYTHLTLPTTVRV